jgi:hypothetical protein
MKEAAADQRADWTAEHLENMARAEGARELRQTVAQAEKATNKSFADAGKAVKKGLGLGSRFLGMIGDRLTSMISAAADFIAPTAPPTREEAEGKKRAAEEQHRKTEAQQAYAEQDAALRELLRQTARDDAEQLRQRRERGDYDETNRGGRDRYEAERERERDRDR